MDEKLQAQLKAAGWEGELSLERLLDGCKADVLGLVREGGRWAAEATVYPPPKGNVIHLITDDDCFSGVGATSVEAAARLWLAWNAKKKEK